MKVSHFPILFVAFTFSISLSGQKQPTRLSINESPLEGQFQYVAQRSDDVESYKMIKRWHFYTLKNHVLDTLKASNEKLSLAYNTISIKQTAIDSLSLANTEIQDKLNHVTSEKEQLVFMGFTMQKASYNKLVWSIITLLVFIAAFALMLFKRSNRVTSETQTTLEEVRAEFETFRKRALEREEGIVRKYHTEINKLKGRSGQAKQVHPNNGGLSN